MDNQNKEVVIKVKDLIEYLSKLDPEIRVELDRDGWDDDRAIESNIRSIFQLFEDTKNKETILYIEN